MRYTVGYGFQLWYREGEMWVISLILLLVYDMEDKLNQYKRHFLCHSRKRICLNKGGQSECKWQ